MEIQKISGKSLMLATALAIVFLGLVMLRAYAVSPFDITFPVSELGNCANNEECKTYCDDLENKDACAAFAVKHGFAKKEEVAIVKKLPETGPGGCSSESECGVYCTDESHAEECLAFAERHGIGKQVRERAKLIRTQGGPGGCQSMGECRAYCETPANQKECIAFAERNKFVPQEKLAAAKQILEEGGPGGCHGDVECRAYCENPDHTSECVVFAEKHNLISEEEASRIKKLPLNGPGGCRGEECKLYCEDEAHQEECLRFAEEHSLISQEELQRARKMAGKTGPGGCRGEACRTYCADPAHREECFRFAEENDLIPKHELERARKMMRLAEEAGPGGCRGEACRTYCEDEANRGECFEFAKKHELIPAEEIERAEKGMQLEKRVREVGGPGGCKNENECHAYCLEEEHVEECLAFAVNQGGFNESEAKQMLREFSERRHGPSEFSHGEFGPPGSFGPPGGFGDPNRLEEEQFRRFEEFRRLDQQFRGDMMEKGFMPTKDFQGPGGCNSPESCIKLCSDPANREECARFNPSRGGPPPGELFREGRPENGDSSRQFSPDEQSEFRPRGEFKGPGGCSSREECTRYCSDPAHQEECKPVEHQMSEGDRMQPQGSFMPRPDGYPRNGVPMGSFGPRPEGGIYPNPMSPQGSFSPRPEGDMMQYPHQGYPTPQGSQYPQYPPQEGGVVLPPPGMYEPLPPSLSPAPQPSGTEPQGQGPIIRFLSLIVEGFTHGLGL